LNGRYIFEDLGMKGRLTLKIIFKFGGRIGMWAGFLWFRIETSDDGYERGNEPIVLQRKRNLNTHMTVSFLSVLCSMQLLYVQYL
jgi:hypothetical protein